MSEACVLFGAKLNPPLTKARFSFKFILAEGIIIRAGSGLDELKGLWTLDSLGQILKKGEMTW